MSSLEQETISTFRSADLPKVCIPADFESSMESYGSDNEVLVLSSHLLP